MPNDDIDAGGDDSGFDPASLGAAGSAPEPDSGGDRPRRAYSKRGTGKRGLGRVTGGAGRAEKKASLDLSSLTGMFVGVHAMLAMQTGVAEIAISDDEGKAFTIAAQNVLRHYSVETTQKTLDWIALMGTAGAIYLPRVVAIAMVRRASRAAAPRRQSHGGKVVHLHEREGEVEAPPMSFDQDFAPEGFSEEGPGEIVN